MRNSVLIVGAMQSETKMLEQEFKDSKNIKVLHTGIGIANTIYNLEQQLQKDKPCAVVNIGMIGSYLPDLHVGDLLVADGAYDGNSYLIDKNEHRKLMNWVDGGEDTLQKPLLTDKDFSAEIVRFLRKNQITARNGYIGSGNMWTSDIEIIQNLNQKYNIMGEDMELWGILFVCQKYQIPASSLKIVSNNFLTDEDYESANGLEIQELIIDFLKHRNT